MNSSTTFFADAILPSLAFLWPITILLLVPVVFIEALYARKRLNLTTGKSTRVFGVANVISTIVGLPVASILAGAFQRRIEIHLFGTRQSNWDKWNSSGNVAELSRAFGRYPRWTLLIAAMMMLAICFLISWWTETAYVNWCLRRERDDLEAKAVHASGTVRNANAISYAFLGAVSLLSLPRYSFLGGAPGYPAD